MNVTCIMLVLYILYVFHNVSILVCNYVRVLQSINQAQCVGISFFFCTEHVQLCGYEL